MRRWREISKGFLGGFVELLETLKAGFLNYVQFCFHSCGLCSAVLGLVAQSCSALCNPMDCSLPGSSAHGIFQARTLEWAAISSSRGWIFPTQRLKPCILHWQAESLPMSPQGSPLALWKLTNGIKKGRKMIVQEPGALAFCASSSSSALLPLSDCLEQILSCIRAFALQEHCFSNSWSNWFSCGPSSPATLFGGLPSPLCHPKLPDTHPGHWVHLSLLSFLRAIFIICSCLTLYPLNLWLRGKLHEGRN